MKKECRGSNFASGSRLALQCRGSCRRDEGWLCWSVLSQSKRTTLDTHRTQVSRYEAHGIPWHQPRIPFCISPSRSFRSKFLPTQPFSPVGPLGPSRSHGGFPQCVEVFPNVRRSAELRAMEISKVKEERRWMCRGSSQAVHNVAVQGDVGIDSSPFGSTLVQLLSAIASTYSSL